MSAPRFFAASCLVLLLSACNPQAPEGATVPLSETRGDTDPRGGAISDATVEAPAPEQVELPPAERSDEPREVNWQPMELTSGEAWISCEHDYVVHGDGEPLQSLGYSAMRKALKPCRENGLLRLRYHGKISAEFTAMIERTAELADTLGIDKRILDLDSTGGQIEQAIIAGDIIGESGWTAWVREGSVCHSSCVLVLAAGDMRMIAGKVGIHRMIRIGSQATSRAELQQELQDVHAQVRQYLQRNGVAFAIADLMMTVPNRRLRLLTDAEMDFYGLDGRNAVEDDLQRITLTRECGEAFVQRKDAFFRAYDRECRAPSEQVDAMADCGQALRERFGFPDPECPVESPLSEYDLGTRLPLASAARDRDA
ncbi:COG3904 family protein [Novilysobacter erysipheiresistens]|uniref:Secreted protein n=1 Tax=Novilysobacter erysipheiresistens TaxID=1749332 RepID=A0ABU7YX54_9GAMM